MNDILIIVFLMMISFYGGLTIGYLSRKSSIHFPDKPTKPPINMRSSIRADKLINQWWDEDAD